MCMYQGIKVHTHEVYGMGISLVGPKAYKLFQEFLQIDIKLMSYLQTVNIKVWRVGKKKKCRVSFMMYFKSQ